MLNRWTGTGRLTRDPELRYTQSGTPVCSFHIAVDRMQSNDGQREADFFPIVTWQKLAESCAKNLKKGRMVGVDGRLQNRSYENRDGQKVTVTEIQANFVEFLPDGRNNSSTDGNSSTSSGTSSNNSSSRRYDDDPFADDSQPIDISEDDLPF